MAAREGYLNALKTLVERDSDINIKDKDGVSKTIKLRAWSHSKYQGKALYSLFLHTCDPICKNYPFGVNSDSQLSLYTVNHKEYLQVPIRAVRRQ